MSGRPGFFGGFRPGDAPERDVEFGSGSEAQEGSSFIRLGDPRSGRDDGGFGTASGFDPVWGTLGPPTAQADDPWKEQRDDVEGRTDRRRRDLRRRLPDLRPDLHRPVPATDRLDEHAAGVHPGPGSVAGPPRPRQPARSRPSEGHALGPPEPDRPGRGAQRHGDKSPRRTGRPEGTPQGHDRHARLQPARQPPRPHVRLDEAVPRVPGPALHPDHGADDPLDERPRPGQPLPVRPGQPRAADLTARRACRSGGRGVPVRR